MASCKNIISNLKRPLSEIPDQTFINGCGYKVTDTYGLAAFCKDITSYEECSNKKLITYSERSENSKSTAWGEIAITLAAAVSIGGLAFYVWQRDSDKSGGRIEDVLEARHRQEIERIKGQTELMRKAVEKMRARSRRRKREPLAVSRKKMPWHEIETKERAKLIRSIMSHPDFVEIYEGEKPSNIRAIAKAMAEHFRRVPKRKEMAGFNYEQYLADKRVLLNKEAAIRNFSARGFKHLSLEWQFSARDLRDMKEIWSFDFGGLRGMQVCGAAIAGAGITFYAAEIISELLRGNWDYFTGRSHADIVTDFGMLATGGAAGRMTMDKLFGVRGISKAPEAVKGIFGRAFPLFTALSFLEVGRTGSLDIGELPKTGAKILSASSLVHALHKLAGKSAKAVKVLKAARVIGQAGKLTLVGAGISAVAEFTIIKWLTDLEAEVKEAGLIAEARDKIAEVISRDYEMLKRLDGGEDVLQEMLAQERDLIVAAHMPDYLIETKVEGVKEQWDAERRKLYRDYLADAADRRERGLGTSEINRDYAERRKELSGEKDKMISEIRDASGVDPEELPLEEYFSDSNLVALYEAGILENSEPVDIDESRYPEADSAAAVAVMTHERLSWNLHGLKKQMRGYLEKRNEILGRIIDRLINERVDKSELVASQ